MIARPSQSARAALQALTLAIPLASLLLVTSCGGGGASGGSGNNAPPPAPLAITTSELADGIYGTQYGQDLKATGGTPPYSWSVASGALPSGIILHTGLGRIYGTPAETGTYEFVAEVRDASSRSARATLRVRIADPLLVTTSVFYLTLGQSYNRSIRATGGIPPYAWTLSDGTLPPGLSLTPDGAIAGTPSEAGNTLVAITVQDSGSPPQANRFSFSVFVLDHVTILTGGLPTGVATHAYHAQLEAAGGIEPYSWRIVSGSLPQGLNLSSSGEIAGTSPSPESTIFTIEVSDSSSPPQTATTGKACTIIPTIYFWDMYQFPDAVKDGGYLAYLNVGGGQPPYEVEIVSGGLPPELYVNESPATSISGNFLVLGTPTATGDYPFTIAVTDSSTPPDTITRDASIRVNTQLILETTTLPIGWTEQPYAATLTATGGVLPYSWTAQPIPGGLELDPASGQISGTPWEEFDGVLGVWVFDKSSPPQYVYVTFPFRVIGKLYITSSRLPTAKPAVPYRVSLGVKGGTLPFNWTISSGALPTGLVLEPSSGQITGTPTTDGTFNFTVQLADSSPPAQTTSKAFRLAIASDLGRNDSPATATAISNGTIRASISPYADPVAGPANPDHDYYALTASPGAAVKLETHAKRLVPGSPLDTVLEIVDAAGARLETCRFFEWETHNLPCLNDDIELGIVQDSRLEFKVPESATEPMTFYVRVFSWDGNARPDYVYDLTVSGAN